MSSLLIKDFPEELHKKLKQQAKNHRRSMMQEAITILEQNLLCAPSGIADPVPGNKPLTQDILTHAIQEGRK
ncbi:MAG: Arc family DNA-binding protein [Spirochaetales bacterium]|nr:Arc family DNA-binding protein [Spirochaetales bacterium]